MDEYIEKHLVDVLTAICEVESFFANRSRLFQEFNMIRSDSGQLNVMLR